MKNSEVDRLGERLRHNVTPQDLEFLDAYRRGFRTSYEAVVDRIRSELGLQVSGRPAKSTTAIVEKLRRSSMRLTQMQDVAGCRLVVSNIAAQNELIGTLEAMFEGTVVDRRAKPSNGYRAVHLIARSAGLPVEIQLRTDLQHAWAELSEKLADALGMEIKYGGGPGLIQEALNTSSALLAKFEQYLNTDSGQTQRLHQLKLEIHQEMITIATDLRKQK